MVAILLQGFEKLKTVSFFDFDKIEKRSFNKAFNIVRGHIVENKDIVCVTPATIFGKALATFASGENDKVVVLFDEDGLMPEATKAAILGSAAFARKVAAVVNSADHKQNPLLTLSTPKTNEFVDSYKLSFFERKWLALPEVLKLMLTENMRFNHEIGRLINDS